MFTVLFTKAFMLKWAAPKIQLNLIWHGRSAKAAKVINQK